MLIRKECTYDPNMCRTEGKSKQKNNKWSANNKFKNEEKINIHVIFHFRIMSLI